MTAIACSRIMPKFTTISPTCQPDGKDEAWLRFRDGGYIAIGWCYKHNLSRKSLEEALTLLPATASTDRDLQDGLRSFPIFWELAERGAKGSGDYVAVKNTNDGLYGIGVIRSGYKYSERKHPTGQTGHYYPHYLEVDWLYKNYILRSSLDFAGQKSWMPFGTIGHLDLEPPPYIQPYIKQLQLSKATGQQSREPERAAVRVLKQTLTRVPGYGKR